MSEWTQEWWVSNAQPIVNAIISFDIIEIKDALINVPNQYYAYIRRIFLRSPEHVIIETFLIIFVLYITFIKKSYDPSTRKETKLTESEINELCEEWEPESLIPSKPSPIALTPLGIVQATPTAYLQIDSQQVLNFGTLDFLGLGSRTELKQQVVDALKKYGCGSCGPRGFFGTIDVHEQLERDIAAFLGTEASIVYSDGEATISSVIPAFAKRGDLLVVDAGCNMAIMTGSNLARCKVMKYEHHNCDDLERVLQQIWKADHYAGRRSNCQRRYVVTEALFKNTGKIIDLPHLVQLCKDYCFRIIIDESYSIGVLGKTGRGVTEHYGIPITDVDIICGSLSCSIPSVGGFSTGSQLVVDNQSINSSGYVFSASAPPFTSVLSSSALKAIENEPELLSQLGKNVVYMNQALSKIPEITVISSSDSPVIHATLSKYKSMPPLDYYKTIDSIAKDCVAAGLAISTSPNVYSDNATSLTSLETASVLQVPSLRLTVSTLHQRKHMDEAIAILTTVLSKHLKQQSRQSVKSSGSEATPLRRRYP